MNGEDLLINISWLVKHLIRFLAGMVALQRKIQWFSLTCILAGQGRPRGSIRALIIAIRCRNEFPGELHELSR